MIGSIRQLMAGDGLRARLLRGGMGSLCIKLIYVALGLAHSIVLARVLGPAGYGVFAYAFALVTMMSVPTKFGLPALLIRETANGQVDDAWSRVHGLWRWATLIALVIGGLLVTMSLVVLWSWSDQFTPLQITTFVWALALVPLIALSNMAGAVLRGLRLVLRGQIPESIVRPALFLILIAVLAMSAGPLSAPQAMALRVTADIMTLAVAVWLLLRQPQIWQALRTKPEYEQKRWLISTLPLAFTTGMMIINQQIGILALGVFLPADDVGIYRVAVQGATLLTVALQAANQVVAPYFARLYRQGERAQLQRVVTMSVRAVALLTLPGALVLVLFGASILQFVFGDAYAAGALPLAILAIGQFGNAFFGSVGFLLNMTGHERDTAIGVAVAAIANSALSFGLIPFWGLAGAAAASALSFLLWNIWLCIAVYKRTGLVALPIRI